MIRDLGKGQRVLGQACEELRQRAKERERGEERVRVGSGPGCEEWSGHEIKQGPRKIGRSVVGYVYREDVMERRRKGGDRVARDR